MIKLTSPELLAIDPVFYKSYCGEYCQIIQNALLGNWHSFIQWGHEAESLNIAARSISIIHQDYVGKPALYNPHGLIVIDSGMVGLFESNRYPEGYQHITRFSDKINKAIEQAKCGYVDSFGVVTKTMFEYGKFKIFSAEDNGLTIKVHIDLMTQVYEEVQSEQEVI